MRLGSWAQRSVGRARLGAETAAASAQAVNATQTWEVEHGTWHVRFCELTGGAEFLIPYYSEAHSGQTRTRSSGARASSRGAPRFRSGYARARGEEAMRTGAFRRWGYARARCEGAMRTGAFQGDGDEGQTICNYCNTRLDVRVRALGAIFFPVPTPSAPATLTPSWRDPVGSGLEKVWGTCSGSGRARSATGSCKAAHGLRIWGR